MGFLEDAQNFMKSHPASSESVPVIDLANSQIYENQFRRLCLKYENATRREIEKALSEVQAHFGASVSVEDFDKFLRTKLED